MKRYSSMFSMIFKSVAFCLLVSPCLFAQIEVQAGDSDITETNVAEVTQEQTQAQTQEQPQESTQESTQEVKEYDPQYTIQALNLAIVSIATIIDTKDRNVLDAEYRRIINNLELSKIADDFELISLYQQIMEFITGNKLRGEELERLQAKLEKAKSRSLLRSLSGIRAYGGTPISFAFSLVTSIASAGFNYYEQKETFGEEFSDEEWENRTEQIRELDRLYQTFLQSAWQLLNKYDIPNEMRLTEDSLHVYFVTLKEVDNEKALRMFESIKRNFDAYPPFYYYYAIRAVRAKQEDLARQCFEEFEKRWRDVLQPDPIMASVAVSMLGYVDFVQESEKVEKYIALAQKNLRDMDDGILRFGIAAAKEALGKIDESKRLLQHNIDFDIAVTESRLALDNLNSGRPFLEGIEDGQYLVYSFDNVRSTETERKTHSTEEEKKAFAAYKRMAEQGNAEGQWRLGYCYIFGKGVEIDEEAAVEWYRKAAEQGNAEGQWSLGNCYLYGMGVEENEKEAVEWYRKSAEQGNAEGQWRLGLCYLMGWGVEENEKEAVVWYRKAAEQDDAAGQTRLGLCYEYGMGVEKDEKQAVEWYRKAAEQGDALAQSFLGTCYDFGTGVEKDEKLAVEWYRRAAEQGYADAQRHLGLCYESGTGVERDEKQAVEWYRKAAEQGDALAQSFLGSCYAFGTGIEKDEKQAVEWYRKAAEQGDAFGQRCLGLCYGSGTGVERDEKQALEWYHKAAEQGNADAQRRLGSCYEYGMGVEKDERQAVEWYRKAAEQGEPIAQSLLGGYYELGLVVEKDEKLAFEWYQKAAEQNDAYGLFNLGRCYLNGIGVGKNIEEAKKLLSKSAELGFEDAAELLKESEGSGWWPF